MTKREAAVMEVYTRTVMLEGTIQNTPNNILKNCLADHFHISNS